MRRGPLTHAARPRPRRSWVGPCAATRNVDCAVGETPCLTASDDAGFEDDEAEVVYWGRCPECRSEALTEAGATTGALRIVSGSRWRSLSGFTTVCTAAM